MTAITARFGSFRGPRSRGPRRQRAAYLYLIPAFAVMGLITIYPLLYQVYLSFTNTELKHLNIRLNLQADRQGTYDGLSAHFSGDGFPGMQFKAQVLPADQFAMWAQGVRGQGPVLDGRGYAELYKPSSYVKPMTYGAVAPGLFDAIVANKAPELMMQHNPTTTEQGAGQHAR